MTKIPFAVTSEDKENAKTVNHTRYSLPSKPKTPTKSIKSFFGPKRSNSLRDITPTIRKADEQKGNTPPPKMIPQSAKRPFTADAGSESIAMKRARRLFSSDETETVVSPFFSKPTNLTEIVTVSMKEDMSKLESQEVIDTQTTIDSANISVSENVFTTQRSNDK
jgi:hypothetical protein